MENSIESLQDQDQLSLLTDIPLQVKEIEYYYSGLALKWNGMDYIHLLTLVQKLNVTSAICANEQIRHTTHQIESLLCKYEYDIPASNSDMSELNRLIKSLPKNS